MIGADGMGISARQYSRNAPARSPLAAIVSASAWCSS